MSPEKPIKSWAIAEPTSCASVAKPDQLTQPFSLFAIETRASKGFRIMTMHQAKGLSADAVFVVAAEDEYIPGRAAGDALGDEGRLLYVSATRARHYLYFTHCR